MRAGPQHVGAFERTALSSATFDVSISDGSSPSTYGSWVQLIASTARDADGFWLHIFPNNSSPHYYEIGIGAAASEVAIISGACAPGYSTNGAICFYVPLAIPAGTRVAMRQASGYGSDTMYAGISLDSGRLPSYGRCTVYGVTVGTGMTTIDPGATANTKGSWAQITSSTTNNIKCFYVVTVNNSNLSGNANVALDIGVGAAASEVVLRQNVMFNCEGYRLNTRVFGPFFMAIPAGTRLAARAQSTFTTATERVIDVSIIAFD